MSIETRAYAGALPVWVYEEPESTGRCLGEPMSWAQVPLQPETAEVREGPAQKPWTPSARLCLSPSDPRCQVRSSLPAPHQVRLGRADHGYALIAIALDIAPAAIRHVEPLPNVPGQPLDPHTQRLWRPPR